MENIILSNALFCLDNFMNNANDTSVPEDQKYMHAETEKTTSGEEIGEVFKNEIKSLVKLMKSTTDKKESAEKVSSEVKSKTANAEEKVKTSSKKKDSEKITMQNRKECPVKVISKEEKEHAHHAHNHDESYHHLTHFVNHLREAGIEFTEPMKTPTGLYEMLIKQINGQQVLISVDVDGLLYFDEVKFFLGRVLPGEEYNKSAIIATNESVSYIKNNQQIPAKFYVPYSMFELNKYLDLQSLKEKDPKKREQIFKEAAQMISDDDISSGIVRAANGEPYRFSFCRYTSPTEFSIVSSRRNLASRLDVNSHLNVSKEIWINYKDGQADLTTKKATR